MRGLFVLNTNAHKNAEIFAMQGLAGVTVCDSGWRDLQPSSSQYDWAPLDAAIAAVPRPLLISLDLAAGQQAPDWVRDLPGMPTATVSVNAKPHGPASDTTLALPWAPQYIAAYEAFMAAAAAHIADTGNADRIVAVRHGLFANIDSEMQIPWCDANGPNPANAAVLAAAGFRPSIVIAAQLAFTDTLKLIFPGALVIQSCMTPKSVFPWVDEAGAVLTKDNSTDNVASMIAQSGDRFGLGVLFMDTSLSTCKPGELFLHAPSTGSGVAFQTNAWAGPEGAMTGSHNDPVPGTPAGFKAIIANGIACGAPIIEIHPADALNYGAELVECAALFPA